jgi:uncharacterized membrane protein
MDTYKPLLIIAVVLTWLLLGILGSYLGVKHLERKYRGLLTDLLVSVLVTLVVLAGPINLLVVWGRVYLLKGKL